MRTILHENKRKKPWQGMRGFLRFALLLVVLSAAVAPMSAQEKKPGSTGARSVTSSVPSGYVQVGNTMLYYKRSSASIDVVGRFGNSYYGSTFSNNGYKVAMKVGGNSAVNVDCLNGTTNNGVSFAASVEPQGELARVCYAVTNTNEADVTVSLGTHADVMIGSNDGAPISRRTDTTGNTYGLTLKDGNGAQLCVLFGSGLSGVSSVSDFWFGRYSQNNAPSSMVGNYTAGSNWMQENGSYDSGMGWCWKNRAVPAGATVVFSYLIGVGDVNLEPSSTFEVTPEDPDGWNDLSRPHRLTLDGEYESPAGLEGRIEYAVEDEADWHALTDMLASGETFTASLVATFDPARQKHAIRFRTVDNVGNATLLPPIEYLDVNFYPLSGIADKTYTGDSLYQTELVCDMEEGQYAVSRYSGNVDAGMATFYVEGVFPYTIGRKAYAFTVHPAPLQGGVSLQETQFVYSGEAFAPAWSFTESGYEQLEQGRDYAVRYENNVLPGTGALYVEGTGNYAGTLSQAFLIDKAPLSEALYSVELPPSDISYDEQPHPATVSKRDGVGEPLLTYCLRDEENGTTEAPAAAGDYDIYLEFSEGALYYGMEKTKIASFSIYHFDESEWQVLEALSAQLAQQGWTRPWDMSQGAKGAGALEGLTIAQGHVVALDLSDSGLAGDFPWSVFGLPQLAELDLSGNQLAGDIGMGMLAVAAANPAAAANLTKVDVSGNRLSGNISLFANSCPALQQLDASDNCISDAAPAISPNVTSLDLGRQTIDRVIDLDLANVSPEALLRTFPTVLIYDHAAQSYNPNLSLLCTTAETSDAAANGEAAWSVVIRYANGQLSMPYVSEQNAYYGESGDILNVMLLNDDNTPEGSSLKMSLKFAAGDANFTGGVDVADLQAIILRVFNRYNELPFNYTAANTIKDDVLNVQDVVGEVNLLLSESELAVSPEYGKTYYIKPAADATKALGVENDASRADVVVLDRQDVARQQWRVAQGWHEDMYAFVNVGSGLALDLSVTNEMRPLQYAYSPSSYNVNQEYFLQNAGGNNYYIGLEYEGSPYYLAVGDLPATTITSSPSAAALFTFEEATTTALARRMMQAEEAPRGRVYCSNGELKIYSEEPVAAFDIRISNAASLSVARKLNELGMSCSVKETANGARIIGYSLSGGALPAGETVVAAFEGNGASVSSAMLVDEQAAEIPASLNDKPTSIGETLKTTADAKLVGGKLLISTDGAGGDTKWSVTALDGRVLGKGAIAGGDAGSHVVLTDVSGVVVVTLETDGVKRTKKLMNN